jgi:hypothetical protein
MFSVKKISIVVLLLGIVGLGIVVLGRFQSRETVYCYRSSLDFYFGITERVIRHFPTPQSTSQPRYHFGCGDGPKPPDQTVVFESALGTDALKQIAQQHVLKCGYALSQQEGDFAFWYSKGSKSLYLKIESTGSVSKVHAELSE